MTTEKVANYNLGQQKAVLDRHGARTAADNAAFLTPHLDKFPDGVFSLLDVGCGPGGITTDFARMYPRAQITGVDSGEKAIARAREMAKQRGTLNANFIVADIMDLGQVVDLASFDVVYCHQVLIHMPKPLEGLKQMKAAAKQHGGIVAARESSLQYGIWATPWTSSFEAYQRVMSELHSRSGKDSNLGAKLLSLAVQAGWTKEDATYRLGTNTVDSHDGLKALVDSFAASLISDDSEFKPKVISMGIANEKELQDIANALRELAEAPDGSMSFVNGELICINGN